MQPETSIEITKWLNTTSRVLYERPERLQKLVLLISEQDQEMGAYASDLAKLRMSGLVMENILINIWNADSVDLVDKVLQQQILVNLPSTPALAFLANLIKIDLVSKWQLTMTH